MFRLLSKSYIMPFADLMWGQAFEVMKKQEETRQVELQAKAAEFKAMQAQAETVCFASSYS